MCDPLQPKLLRFTVTEINHEYSRKSLKILLFYSNYITLNTQINIIQLRKQDIHDILFSGKASILTQLDTILHLRSVYPLSGYVFSNR